MRNLANDLEPFYEPGGFPTCFATTAIRGKRFVTISGNRTSGPGLSDTAEGGVYRVKECDAVGQWAVGVADRDADANTRVGITRQSKIVLPVLAGAAIAAGEEVITDAQGRAIPQDGADGHVGLGRCLNGAANATDAEISLY